MSRDEWQSVLYRKSIIYTPMNHRFEKMEGTFKIAVHRREALRIHKVFIILLAIVLSRQNL